MEQEIYLTSIESHFRVDSILPGLFFLFAKTLSYILLISRWHILIWDSSKHKGDDIFAAWEEKGVG